MDKKSVHATSRSYWNKTGNDFLEAIVLPFYGSFISDENHRLFGDITGKKVLEIGCGNGRSLQYLWEQNAAELWGMDISEQQVERARQHSEACGFPTTLVCSPMEEECGIPKDYFDFVCSIYAIGWTTDLVGTFCQVASYLKKDGYFIFSWSHPVHRCITTNENAFEFKKCYFNESLQPVSLGLTGESTLYLSNRKLSTYINALVNAGFSIEQMIEENDDQIIQQSDEADDFVKRAKLFPVTFVIKARKL